MSVIRLDSVARAKTPRRSNVERTATMRGRIIDAAIHCLNRVGYAASTTLLIQEHARVPRGTLLHHFPTRVDVMLAVAEHVVFTNRKLIIERLVAVPRGRERFFAMTDVCFEVFTDPPAIAFLEILIASRNDAILGVRLPPLIEELEKAQRDSIWAVAKDIGVTDRATVETMAELHQAAHRGLTIEMMLVTDRRRIDKANALLKWYKERWLNAVLGVADHPTRPPRLD